MSDPIRREFLRIAALGGVATAATAAPLDDEPKKDTAKADEAPRPGSIEAEIEARYQLALARFGQHAQIDDDAKKAIRGDIESVVRRAQRLRDFPLTNGDGPFPIFTPHRGTSG